MVNKVAAHSFTHNHHCVPAMVNLNLFCLVDGESTSSAFSVKISTKDTVDDLKNHIKTKKSPRFDDIAVDELVLVQVLEDRCA